MTELRFTAVARTRPRGRQCSRRVPSALSLAQVLKLVISSALLVRQMATSPQSLLSDNAAAEFLSYGLPAFIYFVNNNCLFYILQEVDPTTFQLLSQVKTIFTGLLFRLFLKRRLSPVQYLALVTLACGTACSQLPSARAKSSASANTKHPTQTSKHKTPNKKFPTQNAQLETPNTPFGRDSCG